MSDDPLFVLINSYTTGLAPSVLNYISDSIFTKKYGGRLPQRGAGTSGDGFRPYTALRRQLPLDPGAEGRRTHINIEGIK